MKRSYFIFLFAAMAIFLTTGCAYGSTISLTANTIQLEKASTYDINIIGKRSGLTYYWTTSNSNVVHVNDKNGKIIALNEGEASVTCTITGAALKKIKLTCKIVVGENKEGPQLKKTALSLKVDEQFDINIAKKIAKSNYRWITSNEAVIKINASNGAVTAVGKGDAKVTCTITAPDKYIFVLNCLINVAENNIIWEDDFNAAVIDSTKWDYEYGYVRNSELQKYTNRIDNAFIQDGNLIIKALKDANGNWTSASLHTNNKLEIGNARIEARIKLPKESGAFPAFWMLGADFEEDYSKLWYLGDSWPDAREIDIIEAFGDVVNVQGGVFYKASSSATSLSHNSGRSQDIDITQFHTYAIEKSDKTINFYCDNNLYYSNVIMDDGLKEPFFLLLNLAVGASGGIPNQNISEMEMVVDYVRVTVLEGDPVTKPEVITLDKDTIYGKVNEIKKINDKLLPIDVQNRTVIWKSSDPNVATVYGGNVHMKNRGSCIITATTYNGVSATCKVICN
ncbi:MAG: glycosyl hydrolase [Herbinix sp.]|jgi:beta-glucanase (GH16 family)|nr:glycosyl hydrolase [Herbinix sp.]